MREEFLTYSFRAGLGDHRPLPSLLVAEASYGPDAIFRIATGGAKPQQEHSYAKKLDRNIRNCAGNGSCRSTDRSNRNFDGNCGKPRYSGYRNTNRDVFHRNGHIWRRGYHGQPRRNSGNPVYYSDNARSHRDDGYHHTFPNDDIYTLAKHDRHA